MAINGFYLMDKLRDLKEDVEERLKALEGSTKLLKAIVIYNALTNTVIAFLLWQLVSLMAGHAHTVAQGAQAAANQQIAVIGGGK